jgi:hypothetical protein
MTARLGDRFWAWATLPNALRSDPTGIDRDSTMTPAAGAADLGVPSIIMAGFLPPTDAEADAVKHLTRVAWEMSFGTPADMEANRPNFDFSQNLRPIQDLATRYPNVEAVLLDDLTTMDITRRGMPPSVLADLSFELHSRPRPLSLWGVVYTMSFDIPNLRDYLNFLDVISLWVWHARDLPRLDEYLDHCNELSGGKPVILGLYLHDWGDKRQMPLDLMEFQCERARQYLQQKRIIGAVFLATSVLDVGLPAVAWTREWFTRVRDEEVGDG